MAIPNFLQDGLYPWTTHDGFTLAAITVSPSPKRNGYGSFSTEDQIKYIKYVFELASNKYPKIELLYSSFEYNKRGEIHLHGTLRLHPLKKGARVDYALIRYGKFVNSIIGSGKGVPWYVSTFINNQKDYIKWFDYVYKHPVETWNGQLIEATKKNIIDKLHQFK